MKTQKPSIEMTREALIDWCEEMDKDGDFSDAIQISMGNEPYTHEEVFFTAMCIWNEINNIGVNE
jgi:hypothetical protein